MTPPSRDAQNSTSRTLVRGAFNGRAIPPRAPSTSPPPHHPADSWTAERPFKIASSGMGVAEARRWALSLTAPTCAARDELALVLSELLGNIATHADGGEITLTLSHTSDGLTGSLVHHQPPIGEPPEIPTQIDTEITRLRDLDAPPDDVLISSLAEGGRGLFTITDLTAGTTRTHQDAYSTTTQWTLGICQCLTPTPPKATS